MLLAQLCSVRLDKSVILMLLRQAWAGELQRIHTLVIMMTTQVALQEICTHLKALFKTALHGARQTLPVTADASILQSSALITVGSKQRLLKHRQIMFIMSPRIRNTGISMCHQLQVLHTTSLSMRSHATTAIILLSEATSLWWLLMVLSQDQEALHQLQHHLQLQHQHLLKFHQPMLCWLKTNPIAIGPTSHWMR